LASTINWINFRHNEDDDDYNSLIFVDDTKTKTKILLSDDGEDQRSNIVIDETGISTVNLNRAVGVIGSFYQTPVNSRIINSLKMCVILSFESWLKLNRFAINS